MHAYIHITDNGVTTPVLHTYQFDTENKWRHSRGEMDDGNSGFRNVLHGTGLLTTKKSDPRKLNGNAYYG